MGALLISSSFLRSWDVIRYWIQAAHIFFGMLTFWFVSQLSLSFFPLCRSFGLGLFIVGCRGSLLPSGLSLVAKGGGGSSSLWRLGFLLRWLLLGSMQGLSGISPDQELNPCPLHWQVGSYPLHHQGGASI